MNDPKLNIIRNLIKNNCIDISQLYKNWCPRVFFIQMATPRLNDCMWTNYIA